MRHQIEIKGNSRFQHISCGLSLGIVTTHAAIYKFRTQKSLITPMPAPRGIRVKVVDSSLGMTPFLICTFYGADLP
jgi:hypothetical protein